MSVTNDNVAQRAAYWPVAIVRAIPAVGLGLVITFSADHSAQLGLVAFGVFAVGSGTALAVLAGLRLASSHARPFLIAQGVIMTVAGILSFVLQAAGVAFLLPLVTGFAAITGFLELYSGLRTRRRFVASADWLMVGALTVITALVLLLVPPGFSQSFRGPDGVDRVLDAAVVTVGLLGAYGALIGIYLLIAGFSAKWGTQTAQAVPDTRTKGGRVA
ncbi:MAG: hypothetical protein ACYCZY_02090 [Lacisediminihabitans sp.]